MAKFCSNCGAKLNEEQAVCLECGVLINNTNKTNKHIVDFKIIFIPIHVKIKHPTIFIRTSGNIFSNCPPIITAIPVYITEKIKITIFDINGTFVLLIPYAIPTDIVSKFKITHKITIFIIILLHLTKKCQPLHNMK